MKRNSNKKVMISNRDIVLPKVGTKEMLETIRSISFGPEHLAKLNTLSIKYKLSRSAIVRILLENAS